MAFLGYSQWDIIYGKIILDTTNQRSYDQPSCIHLEMTRCLWVHLEYSKWEIWSACVQPTRYESTFMGTWSPWVQPMGVDMTFMGTANGRWHDLLGYSQWELTWPPLVQPMGDDMTSLGTANGSWHDLLGYSQPLYVVQGHVLRTVCDLWVQYIIKMGQPYPNSDTKVHSSKMPREVTLCYHP